MSPSRLNAPHDDVRPLALGVVGFYPVERSLPFAEKTCGRAGFACDATWRTLPFLCAAGADCARAVSNRCLAKEPAALFDSARRWRRPAQAWKVSARRRTRVAGIVGSEDRRRDLLRAAHLQRRGGRAPRRDTRSLPRNLAVSAARRRRGGVRARVGDPTHRTDLRDVEVRPVNRHLSAFARLRLRAPTRTSATIQVGDCSREPRRLRCSFEMTQSLSPPRAIRAPRA